MKTLKICVITGARSDYGPLKPLLRLLASDQAIELKIIVCGMHLEEKFGNTFHEIIEDDFTISAHIDMQIGESPQQIATSMGLGMIGFSKEFAQLQPDLVLGLGDRFELFSAVSCATAMKIPVVHLGGGDITSGAIDDQWRHAISKMSSWHFSATKEHCQRLINMGEDPERVIHIGEPALEGLDQEVLMNQQELEKSLGFKIESNSILFTWHPETNSPLCPLKSLTKLLEVLTSQEKLQVIFTAANADAQGIGINKMIEKATSKKDNWHFIPHLGSHRYLSTLQFIGALVGNSSSALLEAPTFCLPAVNIGDRQKGRHAPLNVIHCSSEVQTFEKALKTALSSDFRATLKDIENPYYLKGGCQKALNILKNINSECLYKKDFYDIQKFN